MEIINDIRKNYVLEDTYSYNLYLLDSNLRKVKSLSRNSIAHERNSALSL